VKIDLLTRDLITDVEYNRLHELGIPLDDFDYILIVPGIHAQWLSGLSDDDKQGTKVLQKYYAGEIHFLECTVPYWLDRLLTGCCRNRWFLVYWEGIPKTVGVAYHA